MTRATRPVRRQVDRHDLPERPLIVTIYPSGLLGLREKGRRREFLVPAGQVYLWAAKAEADDARRRRRESGRTGRQVARGMLSRKEW